MFELLLETVELTYVFQNDSRVSKRNVKSFSGQHVMDGSITNTCICCIIILRNTE